MDLKHLLLIDTTSKRLMVAVSQDNNIFYEYFEDNKSHRYHSTILIPTIERALKTCDLTMKDLSGIAVNTGPGSFTGIRTGLATVRVMAQCLDLPTFAFNTFELYAAMTLSQPTLVCLDALRGNAYTACVTVADEKIEYHATPSLEPMSLDLVKRHDVDYTVISENFESIEGLAGNPVHWIGQEPPFTPNYMLYLCHHHGEKFRTPWQELQPLYLQEPNITVRKTKAGTLR